MKLFVRPAFLSLLFLIALSGCAAARLAGYVISPGTPAFEPGDVKLPGLHSPVEVRQSSDGIWHIRAADEHDLMMATGYLQARDRLAQLDIFRRLAQGRVSELVGDVPFGDKTSVEADLFNRALDFAAQGRRLGAAASPEERAAGEAFVAGINAWITAGALPLEHRLLGAKKIELWTNEDSLAIYELLMYTLSSNANREVRRLLLACATDADVAERIWPTAIDFDAPALPEENVSASAFAPAPALVPELKAELPKLCPPNSKQVSAAHGQTPPALAWAAAFTSGFSASNSWAVAGSRTASGKPILANDPHLPFMNPPIVWGVEQEMPGMHVAGFTLPGLHRVVFGHNDNVAWSATTNHMDRQDLVVQRPAAGAVDADGYVTAIEVQGASVPFAITTVTIAVKAQADRVYRVRYTADGPLLNDIEPSLPGGIPLTALRLTDKPEARDIDAARGFSYAKNATDFVIAVRHMDGGCTNWVYADTFGTIGYESPCVLPIRSGYSGAFPVAGWLDKYRWQGYVNKELLPAARNPQRGWIATANSRMVPADRFFTALDNDSSEPNRYLRAAALIERVPAGQYTMEQAAQAQVDVTDAAWPRLRRELADALCKGAMDAALEEARGELCHWNGAMTSASAGATLFQLLSNALLDRALADEVPGGPQGALWRYVQNLPQFEANLAYLWIRPVNDPVWDDVRTEVVENKLDIIRAAFADAVAVAKADLGDDADDWAWGEAVPFRMRHLFAGNDGVLGAVVNSRTYAGLGSPTTLYKEQFNRGDRERMRAGLGPVVRTVIDMARPWDAGYALSGGESGWPKAEHYGDALDDWRVGRLRPLSARDGVTVKLVP